MSDSCTKPLRGIAALALVPLALALIGAGPAEDLAPAPGAEAAGIRASLGSVFGSGAGSDVSVFRVGEPAPQEPVAGKKAAMPDPRDAMRTVPTMLLYGAIWMAPMAALMVTAFVRINIVLLLLRQALGSPQIPGNQVLMVLALLLTALVMKPVGERVYTEAILPYTSGQATPSQAWTAASAPIKTFMVDQIIKTNHQDHLWSLYRYAVPFSPGQVEPQYAHEFPFRVVAPAYLLSELTTALVMGFYLYLPFLVIDLVVSAVLAAMGLYMLPPTLIAMPIKLIVFVLADGWLLVASMLAVALLAGLVINILQTVTQLHEPVVGLVPRMVAVLLVLLAILPWLVGRWVSFTVDLIGSIPDFL